MYIWWFVKLLTSRSFEFWIYLPTLIHLSHSHRLPPWVFFKPNQTEILFYSYNAPTPCLLFIFPTHFSSKIDSEYLSKESFCALLIRLFVRIPIKVIRYLHSTQIFGKIIRFWLSAFWQRIGKRVMTQSVAFKSFQSVTNVLNKTVLGWLLVAGCKTEPNEPFKYQ